MELNMRQQLQSLLFTTLPPELRQEIYTFALTLDEPITDVVSNHHTFKPYLRRKLGLDLPLVCRRIHAEIDPATFWRTNTFRFSNPEFACAFFHLLSKRGWLHLPSTIEFDIHHAVRFVALTDAQGKQQIHVNRGSLFTDWDHYLTCSVPVENRESTQLCTIKRRTDTDTLCSLHDDMHFSEHLPLLTGLKTLTLDISELQRDVLDRCRSKGNAALGDVVDAVAELAVGFGGLVRELDGMARGMECKIRVVDGEYRTHEVMLLAEREKGDDRRLAVLSWSGRIRDCCFQTASK